MTLTCSSIVFYLLEKGLLTPNQVTFEPVEITTLNRRNHNFRVGLGPRGGYFLKQAPNGSEESARTLAREAWLYQFVRDRASLQGLRASVPNLKWFDAEQITSVTDLIQRQSVWHHAKSGETLSALAGEALGRTMSRCHGGLSAALDDPHFRAMLPAKSPWIFDLAADPRLFQRQASRGTEFISLFWGFPVLGPALLGMHQMWIYDSVIHGDLRWDNCLVAGRDEEEPVATITDWELFDLGDSAWDLAALVKDFLLCDLLLGRAAREATQTFLHSLIRTYIEERALPPGAQQNFFWRAIYYTAAHLTISAYEFLVVAGENAPCSRALLSLASQVLHHPQQLAEEILPYSKESYAIAA